MRVIAGSQKGRRLFGSQGLEIRPTSGRVKEAIFSILGPSIEEARVLDLYAGTGALGIEALSRGANRVVFVESHPASLRLLQANIERCGLVTHADVRACRVEDFLEHEGIPRANFSVVFADPPYRLDSAQMLLPSLARSAMIAPDSIVLLEHPTRQHIPLQIGRLHWVRSYRHGDTSLSKFMVAHPEIQHL